MTAPRTWLPGHDGADGHDEAPGHPDVGPPADPGTDQRERSGSPVITCTRPTDAATMNARPGSAWPTRSRSSLRLLAFHHHPNRHRRGVDSGQSHRRDLSLGPLPVHPAQPALLHPSRVRRPADPAQPEPPGRHRPDQKAEHDYRVNQLALQYLIAWHRDAHGETCHCVQQPNRSCTACSPR
jgi:hypothetical protein